MNNTIIDKVERSLQNSMKLDAKFQSKNIPSGKIFKPNYKPVHHSAKLEYTKDAYIIKFFNIDTDTLQFINCGSFSIVYEYDNTHVISKSYENEDGRIKFLVALGLNTYFNNKYGVNYLHAVMLQDNHIFLLLTKLHDCGLEDYKEFEELRKSYQYGEGLSDIVEQSKTVENFIKHYIPNPLKDFAIKNWGMYKDDFICFDPYWGCADRYLNTNRVIELCNEHNIPVR